MGTLNLQGSIQLLSEGILAYLNECISKWTLHNNIDDLLNCLKKDLRTTHELFLVQNADATSTALECVACNLIHDHLMPLIHAKFAEDDEYLFEKCKLLDSMNVTADQFGANKKFAIQIVAAVVELASMDNHRSPIEKFNCLVSTYDFIFAELKAVFIRMIAKYSENDHDIPVISNEEVVPVLMVVLIRSKLPHLLSNMFYVDRFLRRKDLENYGFIMDCFKTAIDQVRFVTEKTLLASSEDVCKDLDLVKVIKITSGGDVAGTEGDSLLLKEEMERIASMIVDSTNEQHCEY